MELTYILVDETSLSIRTPYCVAPVALPKLTPLVREHDMCLSDHHGSTHMCSMRTRNGSVLMRLLLFISFWKAAHACHLPLYAHSTFQYVCLFCFAVRHVNASGGGVGSLIMSRWNEASGEGTLGFDSLGYHPLLYPQCLSAPAPLFSLCSV